MHDLVAIGVGPFNLGLAALADPLDDLDAVFLDRHPGFSWHPGMLLAGATVQTPFLADLVTLADPTSRWSYLAFLKQTGRLYPFYIREDLHPLRAEFDTYCRWAAQRLPSIRFDRDVHTVTHDGECYVVHARDRTGASHTYRARRLVLGTGTPPWVPQACAELADRHAATYLYRRDELLERRSITVVGSGQSAAEIYRDLLGEIDRGFTLNWITRSPRFFPLEYTKLTLEMTSPDYVDYFHALPPSTRDKLVGAQAGLYKGIDAEVVDAIFDLLYEKSVAGPVGTRLLSGVAVTGARRDGDGVTLEIHHAEQGRSATLHTEDLVLATGYRHAVPAFLGPVRDRLRFDEHGRFDVRRDYSIDHAGEVFVQNAELHTHGFVAPDLGMAAYRNASILRSVLGREPYAIEKSIAFQEFGVPA